jgi:ketosteroid isomerase-like protein
MSATQREVAEAFSRHDFETAYPHLADDVRWTVVGDREIVGRDAVVGACDESAAYLSAVSTTFRAFEVLAGDGFVVTNSTAAYTGDGEVSVVASCDIYRFAGDTLAAITSYTVELG